jgi:methylmalonyl-CoA mutase cobalamin-binding subunit
MTTKKNTKPAAPETSGVVRARLLLDCHAGRAGAVVELPADVAAAAVADGWADTHPDAVRAAS